MQRAVGEPGHVLRVELGGQVRHRLRRRIKADVPVVRLHRESEHVAIPFDGQSWQLPFRQLDVHRTDDQFDVVDQRPVEIPDDRLDPLDAHRILRCSHDFAATASISQKGRCSHNRERGSAAIDPHFDPGLLADVHQMVESMTLDRFHTLQVVTTPQSRVLHHPEAMIRNDFDAGDTR